MRAAYFTCTHTQAITRPAIAHSDNAIHLKYAPLSDRPPHSPIQRATAYNITAYMHMHSALRLYYSLCIRVPSTELMLCYAGAIIIGVDGATAVDIHSHSIIVHCTQTPSLSTRYFSQRGSCWWWRWLSIPASIGK